MAAKVRRGLGGVYNYLHYTGHRLHSQVGPKEFVAVALGELRRYVTGDRSIQDGFLKDLDPTASRTGAM